MADQQPPLMYPPGAVNTGTLSARVSGGTGQPVSVAMVTSGSVYDGELELLQGM